MEGPPEEEGRKELQCMQGKRKRGRRRLKMERERGGGGGGGGKIHFHNFFCAKLKKVLLGLPFFLSCRRRDPSNFALSNGKNQERYMGGKISILFARDASKINCPGSRPNLSSSPRQNLSGEQNSLLESRPNADASKRRQILEIFSFSAVSLPPLLRAHA